MKHLNNFADERVNGHCVYCGGRAETKEHVPPKVFLDKPYPNELPVVEACASCNQGFSSDEQYMACLLDCVISGSADPVYVMREVTKSTLLTRPAIAEKLKKARKSLNGRCVFDVEYNRMKNIIQKVAVCHVLYELNLPVSLEDAEVEIFPLESLSNEAVSGFENLGKSEMALWPEVGSRAMQRLIVTDENFESGWIYVQRGRYRYAVMQSDAIEVRMVFSEYLACVVRWWQ